jgi:hypothetical protein
MISNHILADKWRVQKALTEQAGHDVSRYMALAHARAIETQERYGIRFRYVEFQESADPESPRKE